MELRKLNGLDLLGALVAHCYNCEAREIVISDPECQEFTEKHKHLETAYGLHFGLRSLTEDEKDKCLNL